MTSPTKPDIATRFAGLLKPEDELTFCSFQKRLNELDEEIAETVNKVLQDDRVSTTEIALNLKASGFLIDRHTVGTHRTRHCLCYI